MKKHATEDTREPEFTLCGIDISLDEWRPENGKKWTIDNADPDCARCRRVIRSRCGTHNVTGCKVCPRSNRIAA